MHRRTYLGMVMLAMLLTVMLAPAPWRSIEMGATPALAEAIPFPEPGNENTYGVNLENIRLRFWAQYRVMYDASNIPSIGKLTFGDTTGYDFFRQRMRLAMDIRPKEADNVGGYLQMEYRGGFGGSSPGASDPRGNPDTVNPFNRLQARGVRYGYIWVNPVPNHTLVAGILPTIDQVGRVLWDAEWDFNVGGAFLGGKVAGGDYRLGFHRVISNLFIPANNDRSGFGKDGDLWVLDYNHPIAGGPLTIGGHAYIFDVNKTGATIGDTREQWWALTASGKAGPASWNGYGMLNTGRLGTGTTGVNHTGVSGKFEASVPIGPAALSLLGIYASGAGRFDGATQHNAQFETPEAILGSNGYWGYTHIFNANGPSDTNDFGITLNNGTERGVSGAGLVTVQTQLTFPIVAKLSGTLEAGYFAAARERAFGTRGAANYMGTEVGAMLTYNMAKNLNLQVGAANAFMGDFLANQTGTANVEKSIYEVFTRFQFAL